MSLEIKPMDLVPYNDPILHETMPRFNFNESPEDPIVIANILAQSLAKHGGYGISAPQIGLRYRAFIMRGHPQLICCFNCSIVDTSVETEEHEEGCLSFPGISFKIKRPNAIKVRYTQPNGETFTKKFIGLTARVVQHETDHLNGLLFFENQSRVSIEMAIKKANKNGCKYKYSDFVN